VWNLIDRVVRRVRMELDFQHPSKRLQNPRQADPRPTRLVVGGCKYQSGCELLRVSRPITFVVSAEESPEWATSWVHMAESRFGGVPDCETGNAVLITHALDDSARMRHHCFHTNVKVTASPRGIPRCPSCHEPDAIEPLQQLDDVWHVRCLNCSCGFTFEVPPRPTAEERRVRADRRATARSGRRTTDLPRPVTCDGCQGPHVKGRFEPARRSGRGAPTAAASSGSRRCPLN
jgi:hypothetical protein